MHTQIPSSALPKLHTLLPSPSSPLCSAPRGMLTQGCERPEFLPSLFHSKLLVGWNLGDMILKSECLRQRHPLAGRSSRESPGHPIWVCPQTSSSTLNFHAGVALGIHRGSCLIARKEQKEPRLIVAFSASVSSPNSTIQLNACEFRRNAF